jgi:hypothetical protein
MYVLPHLKGALRLLLLGFIHCENWGLVNVICNLLGVFYNCECRQVIQSSDSVKFPLWRVMSSAV